jgi:hypothetical protein
MTSSQFSKLGVIVICLLDFLGHEKVGGSPKPPRVYVSGLWTWPVVETNGRLDEINVRLDMVRYGIVLASKLFIAKRMGMNMVFSAEELLNFGDSGVDLDLAFVYRGTQRVRREPSFDSQSVTAATDSRLDANVAKTFAGV